jgi:hypothetical protein
MLYLFGRLALSDSYYFNDDFHADDYPDRQRDQHLVLEATSRPAPSTPHETALPAAAVTKIAA